MSTMSTLFPQTNPAARGIFMSDIILLDRADDIATVTLNRPR